MSVFLRNTMLYHIRDARLELIDGEPAWVRMDGQGHFPLSDDQLAVYSDFVAEGVVAPPLPGKPARVVKE